MQIKKMCVSVLMGALAMTAVNAAVTPIYTAQDLENINQNLAGDYRLMENIDLRGATFMPVGSMNDAFSGKFNGDGYKITNLSLNASKGYDTGLFAKIAEGASITNLVIQNADVNGFNTTGILAGVNAGTIDNVQVSGHVSGYNNTGGLVGANDGKVFDSSANVTVNPQGDFAGGLIGGNGEGTVEQSFAVAVVNDPQGSHVGGLVGDNMGQITQSYAKGAISGVDNVGGLSGGNYQGQLENDYAMVTVNATGMYVGGFSGDNIDRSSIINDYSIGHVVGAQNVGGLVGYSDSVVQSSYWDRDISGQATSAGGTGETDQAMQNVDTYQNWDFNNIWQMNNYPSLRAF